MKTTKVMQKKLIKNKRVKEVKKQMKQRKFQEHMKDKEIDYAEW